MAQVTGEMSKLLSFSLLEEGLQEIDVQNVHGCNLLTGKKSLRYKVYVNCPYKDASACRTN